MGEGLSVSPSPSSCSLTWGSGHWVWPEKQGWPWDSKLCGLALRRAPEGGRPGEAQGPGLHPLRLLPRLPAVSAPAMASSDIQENPAPVPPQGLLMWCPPSRASTLFYYSVLRPQLVSPLETLTLLSTDQLVSSRRIKQLVGFSSQVGSIPSFSFSGIGFPPLFKTFYFKITIH